jgi:hypothetical protein
MLCFHIKGCESRGREECTKGCLPVKRLIVNLVFACVFIYSGTVQASLYFPHIASDGNWETEIAIINASGSATAKGILHAYNNSGQEVGSKTISLAAHGRTQITIGQSFSNPSAIGYLAFETTSQKVCGYAKCYVAGKYRVAVPAVSEANSGDIHISHIASDANWRTEMSLVNTTSSAVTLTFTFNTDQVRTISLAGKERKAFTIESLFDGQPQPNLHSGVVTGGSGIVGLEFFGSTASSGNNYLSGMLLNDQTTTAIYYPHVASDATWWTGIVAYNPLVVGNLLTITPYTTAGEALTPQLIPIGAREKYVGTVASLNLPAETAWMLIQGAGGITGFELFGTNDGRHVTGYNGVGISGKERIFAKIEKSGWTGIAFVNIEEGPATVLLNAYNDDGRVMATNTITLGPHAKVVGLAESLFSQSITNATYIGYVSDRELVGFQLNGSSDGMMLDGLAGLAGTGGGGAPVCPIDFTEWLPTGIGNSPQPTISVKIKSRCGVAIDISSVDMYLDYVKIYPTATANGDGSEVTLTYDTPANLNEWELNAIHEVAVWIQDVYGTSGDKYWPFWVR